MYRYVWVFLLLLAACGGESEISHDPTPSEIIINSTVGTIAINQGVDAWKFREMRPTPTSSALIESEDGFALDLAWQIAEIEYDFDWGGLGFYRDKPNQIVRWNGDTFIRNDHPITTQQIEAFIHSIARFHPSQHYISGHSWTDDYPSHTIQITGVDGQQLVISASSTGNPGDGPWNLIYNDHLYAQYDGAFGYGMEGIFEYDIRGTREEMFGEIFSNTIEFTPPVSFSTHNLPPQLEYGFEGLFPISDRFVYFVDATTGEIKGEVIGHIVYGEYEQEPIFRGTFAELHSITLLPNTPNAVTCVIEPITLPNRENAEGDAAWSFTCPMGVMAKGTPYLYPIEVQLQDNDGNPVTLHGTLSGIWSHVRPPLRLALPSHLRTVLESNPSATQLLAEHEYVSARYNASIDPLPPHIIQSMGGEITFYGTVKIGGIPFPYQITAPFLITDNRLEYWELTPAEVSSFVESVATNPTTQRLIATHPQITFKLSYSTRLELPQSFLNDYAVQLPTVSMTACGAMGSISLPTKSVPLRTVTYTFSDGESYVSGVIEEEEFYPYETTLRLGGDVPAVGLPPTLGIVEPLTIGYFHFNRNRFSGWVRFGLDPEITTPEQILAYQTIAEVWGATPLDPNIEQRPVWLLEEPYTFNISPSGDIQLVACE